MRIKSNEGGVEAGRRRGGGTIEPPPPYAKRPWRRDRYRTSIAARSNRNATTLPRAHPPCLVPSDPCAIPAYARTSVVAVAPRRAAPPPLPHRIATAPSHTCRESLDDKEIGRHDMASGFELRTRIPATSAATGRGRALIAGDSLRGGSRYVPADHAFIL